MSDRVSDHERMLKRPLQDPFIWPDIKTTLNYVFKRCNIDDLILRIWSWESGEEFAVVY